MIAFLKGWLLTLVMVTSIPLIVISGGAMALIISKMASRGQSAYAKAANVVEQTIGSIRTVSSAIYHRALFFHSSKVDYSRDCSVGRLIYRREASDRQLQQVPHQCIQIGCS